MNINYDPAGRQPKGPVAQVLTAILGVLVLAGALMFSLVFFAVIAVAGLILWGWFWWKTRALRRNMQTFNDTLQHAANTPENGAIIEGEFAREADKTPDGDTPLKRLP